MKELENKIYIIRGIKVMLDSDLAGIYGVTTANLIKAVKRNKKRFPEDFIFRISIVEYQNLMFQIGTSSSQPPNNQSLNPMLGKHGGRRKLPYVFTEHGAVMLATILNSPIAVKASILVVKAFVRISEAISLHKDLAEKMKLLESKSDKHDKDIQSLFQTIHELMATPAPPELPPMKKVGYKRQGEE